MSTIQKLTAVFFSFLLFLFLFIFGFLFWLNSTVMNPDFIVNRIDEIDTMQLIDDAIEIETSPDTEQVLENVKETLSQIEPVVKERLAIAIYSFYDYLLGEKTDPEIKETLGASFFNAEFVETVLAEISLPDTIENMLRSNNDQNELPQEFIDALTEVTADMEPDLKEQLVVVSTPVFDYILGVTNDINLTSELRDTILSEDFIIPVLEKLDLSVIVEELLTAELKNQIPPEMEFLTDYVSGAVKAIEPTIKEELEDAVGPFMDYLLGESRHLSIQVSLGLVVETIEEHLKAELIASPPPEYDNLSESELEQLFDETFANSLADILPTTFEIDESIVGPEIVGNFAGTIGDIEDSLTDIRKGIDDAVENTAEPLAQSRKWISIFQMIYIGSMVILALITIGIILVLRNVKWIFRFIGIPFLIFGVTNYFGILLGRFYFNSRLPLTGIPEEARSLLFDLSNSTVFPLEIYSLTLLIVGALLIIASFLYRRGANEVEIVKTG